MSGIITVRWIANGEVVKDQTIPHALRAIDKIADQVEITSPLGDTIRLDVEFAFDPPVECPAAAADGATS